MKCTEILDVGQPAGCSREALPGFKKCQQHAGTRRLVDALETRRTALDDVRELEKELDAVKALAAESTETQVGRLLATIKERGIELAEMTRDRNDFQARWQRTRAGLHAAAAKIEGLRAVIGVTSPGLLDEPATSPITAESFDERQRELARILNVNLMIEPGIPCEDCGHQFTMHAVDDEELRECMDRACPCQQFVAPVTP